MKKDVKRFLINTAEFHTNMMINAKTEEELSEIYKSTAKHFPPRQQGEKMTDIVFLRTRLNASLLGSYQALFGSYYNKLVSVQDIELQAKGWIISANSLAKIKNFNNLEDKALAKIQKKLLLAAINKSKNITLDKNTTPELIEDLKKAGYDVEKSESKNGFTINF